MQGRIETVIGLAAPFLDMVLAVGERVSRIAEPDDSGYYPVRRGPEGSFLGASSPREVRERSGARPPHP